MDKSHIQYAKKRKNTLIPQTNPRVSGYIVEKRSPDDEDFKKIGQVEGRLNAQYVDSYLEDGKTYKYRIEAVTFDKVISSPSQIVQATTKTVPPDLSNVVITNNLPKKIRLSWEPTNIKDLDYYKIYRSKRPNGGYKYYAKVDKNIFSRQYR